MSRPHMLLAYDASGNVVATLDYCVARDDNGDAIGLIDFEAHEASGGALTDIWRVSNAVGSGTWPEFLDTRAHAFSVERVGGRVTALIHRESGHRRERAAIEAAIEAVPLIDGARDIRHIVGGPTKHLALDEQGRTVPRAGDGTPAHLPIHGRPIAT